MHDSHSELLEAIQTSPSARYIEAADPSRSLLIVFSPIGPAFDNPNRFFGNRIKNPDFNRLLLKDVHGLRYFSGLEGISGSLPDTISFLSKFIETGEFDSVGVLGVSASTHTAFVAGCLLDVDAVICLGCRFDLRCEARSFPANSKDPAAESMQKLWSAPGLDLEYLFARDAAAAPRAVNSPIRLYYDPRAPWDTRHANLVDDLPFVTHVRCPGVGHKIHDLAELVFEKDPLLANRATYDNPTKQLDTRKMQTGDRLRAALSAARPGGSEA